MSRLRYCGAIDWQRTAKSDSTEFSLHMLLVLVACSFLHFRGICSIEVGVSLSDHARQADGEAEPISNNVMESKSLMYP